MANKFICFFGNKEYYLFLAQIANILFEFRIIVKNIEVVINKGHHKVKEWVMEILWKNIYNLSKQLSA